MSSTSNRRGRARRVVAITIVGALGLAACGDDDDDADEAGTATEETASESPAGADDTTAGGGSAAGEEVAGGEEVEITFLTNNDPNNVTTAEAVIAAFESAHPNVIGATRHPSWWLRGRQPGQDPARHRRHGRRLRVQLGQPLPGDRSRGQPPADHRSAVRRRSRSVVRRRRVGRR